MGTLVPGHQGTAALGPGPRAFFYFYFYFFWREFIFFKAWMRLIFLMSHFQVSQDLDESFSSLSRLGWVIFKSLKTWMSHFQVSRDLDESLSSLSRLGWVTFKSLKTWMRSGRWKCSSEDPYTPGLWQVCYSSGQARGTLLHPPSALPLGSPGDGVSK